MNRLKRTFTLLAGVVMSAPAAVSTGALPVVAGVAAGVAFTTTAEALPRDRARGRQGARYSRQTGRQVSRARRRGFYTLPRGYRPVTYGRYNYYRVGAAYYYPYFYMGRTVYITIDVDASGNPGPPPAAGSIDIHF